MSSFFAHLVPYLAVNGFLGDSTSLNEQMGDERWHKVLNDYRDVVRSATAARSGTEVATAEGDEVLVTGPVADQLVGSLQLEDRGLQPLKGVSQSRHLLAVRWADVPTS